MLARFELLLHSDHKARDQNSHALNRVSMGYLFEYSLLEKLNVYLVRGHGTRLPIGCEHTA